MRQITSLDLAELLTKDFEGSISFSGRVFCRLRDDEKNRSLDDEFSPTFYEAEGSFTLETAGRDNGVEEGSYALMQNGSTFYFKPRKGEEIESSHQEKYGYVIAFKIDFPTRAVLQIEPDSRNIRF